jgi:hypothetical protein
MSETLQETIDSKLLDWVGEKVDEVLEEIEDTVKGLIQDEIKTKLDIG